MEARNDNFLDFTTFFYVIKESTTLNNEDLFAELTGYLYADASIIKKSMKNETSDILRKKKPFPTQVRKFASLDQVDAISKAYKKYLMDQINNPNQLASKLLYLIQQEECFFEKEDYEFLKDQQDTSYIIAYIFIKTVNTSDRSKELRHSQDYNPFKNYHESVSIKQKNTTKVEEDLRETSVYLENKYSSFSITKRLLSKGRTLGAERDFDSFDESFSIVSDSEGNTKPLQDYMATGENLIIIGEGGIGKTTALFTYINKCRENKQYDNIPLYIRLSNCSTYTDHEHMILNALMNSIGYAVNGKTTESYKDIIDEFSVEPSDGLPKYTLLLDGFNEITSMDLGEIRFSIAKEINSLCDCSNVRIILTTRDSDLYGIKISDFVTVKATGIELSDVEKYLKDKISNDDFEAIQADDELLQYLRIPLFLKMFTYSEDICEYLPRTRGEILFNYYNGINGIYTEKKNRSEKCDRKTSLTTGLLLDFLLPQIGYYMAVNELFQIDIDTFDFLVNDVGDYIAGLIKNNPILNEQYNTHTLGIKKIISAYEELNIDDVLLFLTDELGVFYKDAEDRIYFCHQYVRDYFAAFRCVNGIINLAFEKHVNLNNTIYWGLSRWSEERIQLICEIMRVYPRIETGNLIQQSIEKLRSVIFNMVNPNFTLSNLISTLSYYEQGDLSNYDLSQLDLRECRLNDINFSNPYTNNKTSFAEVIISETTFASETHNRFVKAWTLSDNERYIVSLAYDMELKIWNIANQECIYTSKIFDRAYYGKVKKIKYIELKKLLLVLNEDPDGKYTAAWTYNTRTKEFNSYFTSSLETERILFFDYDYFQEKLFIISDKSEGYMYQIGYEIPRDTFPINPEFTKHLIKNPLSFQKETPWEIYLLDDNKILLVESDVFSVDMSSKAKEHIFASDNILNYRSREDIEGEKGFTEKKIELFLYDKSSMDLQSIQFESSCDNNDAILFKADENNDVVHEKIAISKDKRKIALYNACRLYVYDISEGDYLFKSIGIAPAGYDWIIRYCNSSNVLSLYNDKQVVQYSVEKREILRRTFMKLVIFDKSIVTQNYRIVYDSKRYCYFRIINLYSLKDNYMFMNEIIEISLSFISRPNKLCVLYSDGTIICLDKNNLTFLSSYNICPRMHISSCVYLEEKNLICAVATRRNSQFSWDERKLLFFNVENAKCVLMKNVFGSGDVFKIVFYDKYVVIFMSYGEVIVVSTETYLVVDKIRLDYFKEMRFLKDIIVEKNGVYLVYSREDRYCVFGGMRVMTIDNDRIHISEFFKIPSIILSEIDSSVVIRRFQELKICKIRNFDKTEERISYVNGKNEVLDKSLEWNWVYLEDVGDVIEKSSLLLVENHEKDEYGLIKEFANEKYIVYKDNKTYIYNANDNVVEEIFIGESIPILIDANDDNIYLRDNKSNIIYRYDVKKHCSPDGSNYLHTNILVNGCDFTGLKGYTGAIPRYMIKSKT